MAVLNGASGMQLAPTSGNHLERGRWNRRIIGLAGRTREYEVRQAM